jgi:ribose 1,5-bisphosphokinase
LIKILDIVMGSLFYIMGASGAGKDVLIQYARRAIGGRHGIAFSHRYITRPPEYGGENHIYLSPEEFLERKSRRCLAMDWEAHGFMYGIGCEIDIWMERGLDVVVNGSRFYYLTAKERYPLIQGILIEAGPDAIRQRLQMRGREGDKGLEGRIRRIDWPKNYFSELSIMKNEGILEEAGNRLVSLLLKEEKC